MKKIIIILAWVLLIASVIFAVFYTGILNRNKLCKSIEITIDYNNADPFFSREDIQDYIYKNDTLVGKKLSEINIGMIENLILSNPYVYNAEVFKTMDGVLKINVIQRKAIVRVYNSKNQQYYLDDKGVKMPLNYNYPARVLIANGNIDSSYVAFNPSNRQLRNDTINLQKDSLMYNLFKLASYINNDEFLKAMVEQIYINNEHEFEIVPKIGNQIVLFGDASNLKEKTEKLFAFYKDVISQVRWDKYRLINLKFKNQVVCTKN